jgi:hypothetical protein
MGDESSKTIAGGYSVAWYEILKQLAIFASESVLFLFS